MARRRMLHLMEERKRGCQKRRSKGERTCGVRVQSHGGRRVTVRLESGLGTGLENNQGDWKKTHKKE